MTQTQLFSLFFIEFIGVTLSNISIWVLGVWVYNTSSVYCLLFSSPKWNLLPSPFTPLRTLVPPPHPPLLLVILLHLCLWDFFLFCLILFPLSPIPSKSPPLWQLSVCSLHRSVFILLVYFVYLIPHISETYVTCLSLSDSFHLA